jgi:hypothetical protein
MTPTALTAIPEMADALRLVRRTASARREPTEISAMLPRERASLVPAAVMLAMAAAMAFPRAAVACSPTIDAAGRLVDPIAPYAAAAYRWAALTAALAAAALLLAYRGGGPRWPAWAAVALLVFQPAWTVSVDADCGFQRLVSAATCAALAAVTAGAQCALTWWRRRQPRRPAT